MNHKRVRTKIVLAGLIHFIIALIYRHLIGLSNTDGNWIDKWESMWQAIPLNQLSESPFTSIYYFHAQPPVFNIVQAALVKLVPSNPFELLQTVYILLGVVMVMMSGVIIYHLILRQIVGDILLFIITLHASLFIYEAYELQTHLTAFLVIVVIFCLVQLSQTKHYRYLYLAMLTLNVLILTDSFFRPFLLILFGLAFVIWTPNNKLKVAFGLLLTSSITILFLLKNLLLFGFLGLNSGQGLDLYNMVQWEYTAAELEQLAEEQVIDPALSTERVNSPPSTYANYGYDTESDISMLNQDDRNNINYVDISQMYGENALTLIKRSPTRYIRRVAIAYVLYFTPSSHFSEVSDKAELMGLHEFIYAFVLNPAIPISMNSEWDLHVFNFILPLTLLFYLGNLVRKLRFSTHNWRSYGRENIVIITMCVFVVYGVIFGTFFEYGENSKLRYLTEIPMMILIVTIVIQAKFRIPRLLRSKHNSVTH